MNKDQEKDQCFSCGNKLSNSDVHSNFPVYRRLCCGTKFHHLCFFDDYVADCRNCGAKLEARVTWIATTEYSATDDQPPNKKVKLLDENRVCCICLEAQTSADDQLVEFRCCRQNAHDSCLRKYFKLPTECRTVKEFERAQRKISSLHCFVCRRDKHIFDPKDFPAHLIPKSKRGELPASLVETNALLEKWRTVFSFDVNCQLRDAKFDLQSSAVIIQGVTKDGKSIRKFNPMNGRMMPVKEFVKNMNLCVRYAVGRLAGVGFDCDLFSKDTLAYCELYNIVGAVISFKIINSRRDSVEGEWAFNYKKVTTILSEWEFNGHLFFLDAVPCQASKWERKRIR